jgi:integrase
MPVLEPCPPSRGIPWTAFADEVLKLYAPPMRRRGTRDKTRQVLAEFARLCPRTADLSPATIADWIGQYPDRAPATVDGLLRHLSAVCTYGASRAYLVDPFDFRPVSSWLPADLLDRSDSDPFPRHRTAAEIGQVLRQADSEALSARWEALRLRAVVYTLAFTGAHKTEVLGLRTSDVDLAGGLLSIRSHGRRRLKTRARSARLPIAGPLAEVLAGWSPLTGCEWLFPHRYRSGPWLHGSAGRRPIEEVRALGDRAGVPGLTLVAFRHSFATLAESWGIGELMLQRLLRHARPRTQDHYRHADLEAMRAAAGKVRFG